MQLTLRSNHAVRMLIYAALGREAYSTVKEIASACHASEHHMAKIANHLVHMGILQAVRGRNGGVRLAQEPSEINLGAVVREMENGSYLTECFIEDGTEKTCPLLPACTYRAILVDAQEAFFAVLDRFKLSDILTKPAAMAGLLQIETPVEPV